MFDIVIELLQRLTGRLSGRTVVVVLSCIVALALAWMLADRVIPRRWNDKVRLCLTAMICIAGLGADMAALDHFGLL